MTEQPSLAIVFPGQGSQFVGMLAPFLETIIAQNILEQATQTLGFDVKTLFLQGPKEFLDQTEITQPALLVASFILWNLWKDAGGSMPAFAAGHSLGEYSAYVCAGAIDFDTGLKLVAHRGKLMQSAVSPGDGAMAAIVGLDEKVVSEICEQSRGNEILSPANFNAIGQIVISGHATAVARAVALANEKGAKLAKTLAVSVPSHCALMKPAAEQLSTYLEKIEFLRPEFPILNNVDVTTHHEAALIRETLIRQLYSPVRWVETIQKLSDHGVTAIIEMGPGNVLTGLIKRINPTIKRFNIDTPSALETVYDEIQSLFA